MVCLTQHNEILAVALTAECSDAVHVEENISCDDGRLTGKNI